MNYREFFTAPDGWGLEAMTGGRVKFRILISVFNTKNLEEICILLFIRRGDSAQSKVVKISDREPKKRGEFQYDRKGKALYNSNCHAFFLRKKRNGDICVSDSTALVVIDKVGKFRFRYHGEVFDTFDKPFKPRELLLIPGATSYWPTLIISAFTCLTRMETFFDSLHLAGR